MIGGCFRTAALFVAMWMAFPAAAQNLSFDVASIRQNNTGFPPQGDVPDSNVPLGPGNVYSPTGGLLSARNQSLLQYISFAYRMTAGQEEAFGAAAPGWVSHDRFNLQARTEKADVTKDELRLMMRSLLAERFALKVHYETRVTNVFGLLLVRPGVTGPRLRPHTDGDCSRAYPVASRDEAPVPKSVSGGFPAVCGGLLLVPGGKPTHYNIGARDVPISVIANALPSWGDLGRHVVDETGLTGHYDFALDFVPKHADPPPGAAAPADEEEPNFLEALRTQLGLKLESQKQAVDVLVLDHIERLSEN